MRRILILGGTTEARRLAERLVERVALNVTVSLAGRTMVPAEQAAPVRIGGFGGAEGLAQYLASECVDVLIDATHPYAAIISANAAAAAAATGIPLLALRRPPWAALAGDCWIEVADTGAAVQALGEEPRRVFLTLGKTEIRTFARAPQHHYLVRSIEPVDPPLSVPHVSYVTGRGPFTESADRALLAAHDINVIVAKNSGGAATYGKIEAARVLGLPVILLRRPALPEVPTVGTVEEAMTWLSHAVALRGV
jgi:precorrin-6A/cobalt-precorrin-6A reductase